MGADYWGEAREEAIANYPDLLAEARLLRRQVRECNRRLEQAREVARKLFGHNPVNRAELLERAPWLAEDAP